MMESIYFRVVATVLVIVGVVFFALFDIYLFNCLGLLPPKLERLADSLFRIDSGRKWTRTQIKRKSRQRRWRAGIGKIQRKQERKMQKEMSRQEREAVRGAANEISHTLAIHQEILERMYGQDAASMSKALRATYQSGKQRQREVR